MSNTNYDYHAAARQYAQSVTINPRTFDVVSACPDSMPDNIPEADWSIYDASKRTDIGRYSTHEQATEIHDHERLVHTHETKIRNRRHYNGVAGNYSHN